MSNNSSHQALLKTFNRLYPEPRSELNFKNPYQLLVSVVLSAQCTDKKVNETTPELFKQYPSFAALAKGTLPSIEKIIRPINYYKTKARNLSKLAQAIVVEHGGETPKSREGLMSLPGVGRKTANVVLCELGVEKTLPVDTHVFRVSKRLGLAHGKTPDEVEEELRTQFPSRYWRDLHHWLIFHGRRICKAARPLCADCALNKLCPSRQSSER